MDAPPQRHRTRVFADENAATFSYQQQTVHSRHKSQPVLKAGLTTAGPQKLGPRRAFGDVSNAAVNRLLRDDSAVPRKGTLEKEKHLVVKKVEDRPMTQGTDLYKQYELPVSKPAITNVMLKSADINVSGTSTKPVDPEIVRPQPIKAIRKSRTTVFQEKGVMESKQTEIKQDLAIVHSRVVTKSIVTPPDVSDPHESNLLCQVVEEPVNLLDAAEPKTNVQRVDEGPVDLGTTIKVTASNAVDSYDTVPTTDDDATDLYNYIFPSDLSKIDELPKPNLLPLEIETFEPALEILPEPEDTGVSNVLKDISGDLPAPVSVRAEEYDAQTVAVASVPTPEEYWDEEEEDGYAEDGYVTARSFKSAGDNLTVNATHTLYPHVDQAVKREIAAAKALIEATRDPEEVEDERWDTSMVAEYGDEIFEYMRELEVRMSPNPHYMDKQNEIQWSMRAVLMDWIVQVHHRFGLLPETLFLCVNLIDRFLSQKIVSLTKLQLVGATAIFVAAKYEEVDCPSIQEVQFMVDNGYKIEEILKAERFMLSMLGFELGFPGPMSFLRRISKADDYDLETRTLAKYFLELTIMDERFLACVSSFSAAGAHCLARLMLHKGNWSPSHIYYSNYTYSQLLPLIKLLLECCEDPMTHHAAIFEKYLDKRYKKAAQYVQTELARGFRIPDENINVLSPMYASYHHAYGTDPRQWESAFIRT